MNTVPKQIHSQAAALQVAPIPAAALSAAKIAMKAGIGIAKADLKLTDADVKQLDDRVDDNAIWTAFDDSTNCIGPAVNASPTCTFIVRADSLNVYPNAIELVFLQGKATNATYALHAALVGIDKQKQTNFLGNMCQQSPQQIGATGSVNWTTRPYFAARLK